MENSHRSKTNVARHRQVRDGAGRMVTSLVRTLSGTPLFCRCAHFHADPIAILASLLGFIQGRISGL